MKNRTILMLLGFFALLITNSFAQENRFFMPAEIKKAYEKGTRSYDGQPGEKYWQNAVDYHINVTVIPSEQVIDGEEEVVFHNNSPDEINELVVRLYGDVYKKGNLRYAPVSARDINDGVELKEVVINGVNFDLDDWNMTQRSGTNIRFILQKSLQPGSELTLNITWMQNIPFYTRRRMGAYDSTTFFVGQWYPQIAVYDDIFGWDNLNYTLTTEFYNNLGNYDVNISVPNDYMVWATGTLENPEKVLPGNVYVKYQKARSGESTIHILSSEDIREGFKTLNNSWHFTASDVSDFAFAMSNHHLWDAALQQVADKQVFISSVYPMDTTTNYSGQVATLEKSMQHLSEDIPGTPYPYETFTTFITNYGGYGMEYPMMANNGDTSLYISIHEMAHTWFPMYVRTNERRWAWMDEGWADFNTAFVVNRYFENDYETEHLFSKLESIDINGTIEDLPLITSSQFLNGSSYAAATYSKPATFYIILHQYLGEDTFLKCYHEYIRRWAKKSPSPYDFFFTFEDVSDQDLSWLWIPWFFEFGITDVAIQSFEKGRLTIINKGNRPIPLFIDVRYNNGDSKLIEQNAHIWENGNIEKQFNLPSYEDVQRVLVNTTVDDFNLIDNVFPSVQSLYQNIKFADELMGQYRLHGIPIIATITEENGIMYFKIGDGLISHIIYPNDNTDFNTLDGSIHFKFNLDDSGHCMGVDFDLYGTSFSAEKFK